MSQNNSKNEAAEKGPSTQQGPRRQFTRAFKNKILNEIKTLKEAGMSVGDFLRRESLYASQVSAWRKLQKEGLLGDGARGRGRPKLTVRAEALTQLEARNRKLEKRCRQMELIIEAQKKIAQIFQPDANPSRPLK